MVSNAQVARFLRDYSALLVVSGADRFKVKAYRKAAETLEGMSTDLGTFLATGHDLQELPGVGKAIGPTIQRIMRTGHMPELDKLSSTLEPSVAEIASRPALDPKTVTRVYKKLKIGTLTELQERLDAGEIREKLGQRVEFQIRQGLANRPRMLFKRAFEFALKIEAYLKALPEVTRVEITGSLRRRQETIGDLNFLVTGNNASQLFKKFQAFAGVESSEQLTADHMVYRLSSGFEVTLHWTPAESWGLNWILTTRSTGHVEDLNQVAAARKLELSVSRLTRRQVDMAKEIDVYHALGMPFIEPELREGRGEIDAALHSVLPDLIRVTDIQGDLHMHTTASDGVNSIAEMAAAAQAKGYKYIAITDHSRSLKITNGLSEERLREHIKAIDKLNSKLKGFTVLKSAEVDILEDGSLDYSNEMLKELDLAVCSIHSRFAMTKEQHTTRILRAMDNPYFSILGHPTGRMLLRRPGYEIDLPRILEHAKQNGCHVEINANPNRLDLSDEDARLAKQAGVKIAINTDAHSIAELEYLPFGINQARRAWLTSADVLNTLPLTKLKRALSR